MAARFTIVGLGEALFDILPQGAVLGGAPLNVAVHAHQLGQPVGGRGVVVSRVGQDELGEELLAELDKRGMTRDWVQSDPDHATGEVYVNLAAGGGSPSYDIVKNVAWDWLQFDPDTEALAQRCDAVAFGSLAQREPQARSSIYRFLDTARRAIRLFDVNLRQDFYDEYVLRRSCELATVIKLNVDELPVLLNQLGITPKEGEGDETDRRAEALRRKTKAELVALTRGQRGTVLYRESGKLEGEPVSYPAADSADSVGAGDACSAGLLLGLVRRWPHEQTVALANHMGAYVASQPGATPGLPEELLGMVKGS